MTAIRVNRHHNIGCSERTSVSTADTAVEVDSMKPCVIDEGEETAGLRRKEINSDDTRILANYQV